MSSNLDAHRDDFTFAGGHRTTPEGRNDERGGTLFALARGYAVPSSEAHINRLGCGVVVLEDALREAEERLQNCWNAGQTGGYVREQAEAGLAAVRRALS